MAHICDLSLVPALKIADLINLMVCLYRVGSSLPPCYIACFDEYENQIAFTSVPTLEVELNASPGFQIKIDMIEGQPGRSWNSQSRGI